MKQKLKNNLDSLIGKAVIVHPFLTTDPYNNRGMIGIVKNVNSKDGLCLNVTVEFGDKQKGQYEADGIYTLLPEKAIRKRMRSNVNGISRMDREEIVKILNLMKHGQHKNALLKVMGNDSLKFKCVCSCQEWVEMRAAQAKNKNKGLRSQ